MYRHDLLQFRMKDLGLSDLELAKLLHLDPFSLRRVLNGQAAGSKTLWPVSDYLDLDWAKVHDLELKKSEFHLAVRNGGSER